MRWMLRIVVLLLLFPLVTLLALALAPDRMLGQLLSKLASLETGLEYQIDSASLDVFSGSPGLALSGVRAVNSEGLVVLANASVSASVEARQWLKAKFLFSEIQLNGGPLKLVRFEDGSSNFDQWLPAGASMEAALAEALLELEVPAIEKLQIDDLAIEFDDRQIGRTINLAVNARGSTSFAESPLKVNLSGTLELQSLFAESIPDLSPLQFEAQIIRQDEQFLVQGIDANFGQSKIKGAVRINPTSTPVDVAASFESTHLDLNHLWDFLESEPALGSASEAETQASWLFDETFDLQPLLRQVNGALRFTADHIELDQFPLESFDVRAQIQGNQLQLLPMDFGLAGGNVEAEMTMQVGDEGIVGDSQLRIRGVEMGQIANWDSLFMGAVGKLGGRAGYRFKGNSLASLARAADGEMTLLMSGGELNRLIENLIELDQEAGNDSWRELSDQAGLVKCGYLETSSEFGANQIEHLVLGTETTVFLIEGDFDANQEAITLSIEPHAVDLDSSDELAAMSIRARPGEIQIQALDKAPSRDAAIAKLKQIASPAAALLPLLASGEEEICYGLVSSLDD